MPLDKVKKVLRIARTISLETPVGDEETFFGDFIEDKNALIPIDAAEKFSQRQQQVYYLH